MRYLLLLLVFLALAAAGLWIRNRIAPIDAARWHQAVDLAGDGPGDWPGPNSHLAARATELPPERALAAVHDIARRSPGTSVLAGAPVEGRITYVTATPFWGFRDMTTVEAHPRPGGSLLVLYGRAELGKSDLGVNRGRISAWLAALAP